MTVLYTDQIELWLGSYVELQTLSLKKQKAQIKISNVPFGP